MWTAGQSYKPQTYLMRMAGKPAGMPGSKKKYIFPHVMGWPSLHIHEHRGSIAARVIRVLALTSCCSPKGDESH